MCQILISFLFIVILLLNWSFKTLIADVVDMLYIYIYIDSFINVHACSE